MLRVIMIPEFDLSFLFPMMDEIDCLTKYFNLICVMTIIRVNGDRHNI